MHDHKLYTLLAKSAAQLTDLVDHYAEGDLAYVQELFGYFTFHPSAGPTPPGCITATGGYWSPFSPAPDPVYFDPAFDGDTYDVGAKTLIVAVNTLVFASRVRLPVNAAGSRVTVVDVSGNANNRAITILPRGAESVQGAASLTISLARQSVSLFLVPTLGGWSIC